MKEMGFRHRTPAIKPKLTERHRELRLQFAQRYVHQDLNFWGRVIFSDEKTFSSTSRGKLHCWRRDNTSPYKISKTTENMNVTTALQTVYCPELMLNHNGDWYENMNFRQGYKGKPCRADFNGH
ncbi:hypothetical protein Pmani_002087 [Petrolisthes manimaculis]|uniref:Transposase Tc1-like domain-containing protein n=1 Tax=Petrolisthes manimaculis TaxID=1843537 RepID=A0AAE1UKQ7_9EUCA|nr:hypothetical protein Pmani_002087 [Petrolisthes manimaculis]